VLEDHGGRIELKDASEFRPGQRGAWMRMRFSVSGHAPKIEVKEPTVETREQETKEPAAETAEGVETTNNEARIKATTGS